MINIIRLIQAVIFCLLPLLITCGKPIKMDSMKNGEWLEKHRQLALKEWLLSDSYDPKIDPQKIKKYVFPDSIKLDEIQQKYIKENPLLPPFVIKTIVERKENVLITIGEFFLIHPELTEELMIVAKRNRSEWLQVGYKKWYSKEVGMITGGPVWWFKYGFLWSWGYA